METRIGEREIKTSTIDERIIVDVLFILAIIFGIILWAMGFKI